MGVDVAACWWLGCVDQLCVGGQDVDQLRCYCHVLQEESDLPYEEEILRHPYQVKCWMRYIEHKSNAPKAVINLIYERALKELPGR